MKKNDDELNKKRGKRLTICRNAAGLSQEDLGKRVGLTKQQIWNIEHGTRSLTPSNALLIGKELAVDPDYLLCNTEISSYKQFFMDNMKEGAEKPIKSQIIYELIKAHPQCVKIGWCLNGQGEKKEWGWQIEVLMKAGAEMNEYKGMTLDIAAQIKLFDELCDFLGYQLYKHPYDPGIQALFDLFDGFHGEPGAGFSAKDIQEEIERLETQNRLEELRQLEELNSMNANTSIEEPVLYDEFKKSQEARKKNSGKGEHNGNK